MSTNALERKTGTRENGRMAKKSTSGKHIKPRTPVQFPAEWLKVARILAAKQRQPTLWYLISLLSQAAIDAGLENLPDTPWEGETKAE